MIPDEIIFKIIFYEVRKVVLASVEVITGTVLRKGGEGCGLVGSGFSLVATTTNGKRVRGTEDELPALPELILKKGKSDLL